MEIEFNIPVKIDIDKLSKFSDISIQINDLNLNKMAFEKTVQTLDEFMTTNQAGEKNQRGQDFDYSRVGTAPFSVLTDFGRISLMLNKIKNEGKPEGSKIKTVLEEFTSHGDIQLTEGFKKNLRDLLTHTTYRRSTEVVNMLRGMGFKKDVLWEVVNELGISASETYDVNPNDYDLIMVDGSGGKGKHTWYVFIGVNIETGTMIPIHHSVRVPLSKIKMDLEGKGLLVSNKHILIADGEIGIHREFNRYKIQMCAFHFEQAICYKLWEDGMTLKERKKINDKIRGILNELKNSVKRNAIVDQERLVTRISKTQNKLIDVAQCLLDSGYQKARNFILKHLETVTLFAKEAVNLVKVPWTNNIMERFIGEVSFRIKNRWAHWGKEGLNAIIHLIIQKYCKRNQVKLEF